MNQTEFAYLVLKLAALKQSFYNRDTITVARQMLGTKLVRDYKGTILSGVITETEAYLGLNDSACHASIGRTPRNSVMFGSAGIAYVYFIYGIHYMLNIVTERKDKPCAVLIRAIKPVDGVEIMESFRRKKGKDLGNGPAKLCQALAIDKSLNGWDVTKGKRLWLESHHKISAERIDAGPRIGIEYAETKDRNAPLRFWATTSSF